VVEIHDPEAFELLDSIYNRRRKPEPVQVVDLAPLGPDAEGKVRSKPDQPATQVIFINRTSQPVERFWLDPKGKRRSYGHYPARLGPRSGDIRCASLLLNGKMPPCWEFTSPTARNWAGGDLEANGK